jgi:hypothetical protein
MATGEDLDGGHLVGGDDVLVATQLPTLEDPGVEVQHAPGLGLEVGVAGKDPAAVRPGPDGVLCGFRVKAITRFG